VRQRDRIDILEEEVRESDASASEYTLYEASREMEPLETGWVYEERPGPLPPSMGAPAGWDRMAHWSDAGGENIGACVVRRGKRIELIPISFRHAEDRQH